MEINEYGVLQDILIKRESNTKYEKKNYCYPTFGVWDSRANPTWKRSPQSGKSRIPKVDP